MTQVPPNDIPDLRQRLDRMASDIDELKRRRIDFPTDVEPDCKGCICQGFAAGITNGIATVAFAAGGSAILPMNISRVTDCSQGGGLLLTDSSGFVAAKTATWIIEYQIDITHSGAGLRSLSVETQIPPQVGFPHSQHVAGVPQTATTENLRVAGCFSALMYPGDYVSFYTTGYAAAGTYDTGIFLHVMATEVNFDSF